MKKHSSQYICQQCGYTSVSWLGKCPNCSAWNSLIESKVEEKTTKEKRRKAKEGAKPIKLSQVSGKKDRRILTNTGEFNRVLGGGLIPGQVVLLAGDPGIGKSTLLLQLISKIGGLYISAEESPNQVKIRADRLSVDKEKDILVLAEEDVDAIIYAIESTKNTQNVAIVVIDSIQMLTTQDLTGTAGSIGQVRESAYRLTQFAKKHQIPIFIVGHVTKEGAIAGPKVLEHIVDTVLYLEGDRYQELRLLRSYKNRFGPVDEIGVFEMKDQGMVEIANPSKLFLGKQKSVAGKTVVVTLEGTRPLLVEVEALIVASSLPMPRRIGTGVNNYRLQMLIAIVQKHLRLPLGNFDIFVNCASGMKIFEPAADLGICLAIVSSFKNKPLPPNLVVIGEVGLLGEIRQVAGIERREAEAKRLGFKKIVSPENYTYLAKTVADLF